MVARIYGWELWGKDHIFSAVVDIKLFQQLPLQDWTV